MQKIKTAEFFMSIQCKHEMKDVVSMKEISDKDQNVDGKEKNINKITNDKHSGTEIATWKNNSTIIIMKKYDKL